MQIEESLKEIVELEAEWTRTKSKQIYTKLTAKIFEVVEKNTLEKELLEHYFRILDTKSAKLKLSRFMRRPKVQCTLENPPYDLKVTGVADIESGVLSLGNEIGQQLKQQESSQDFQKQVAILHERGDAVMLELGGDGAIGIELRVMSSGVPSISKKEAKICRSVSQEYCLRVTKPTVLYGDLGCTRDDETRKIMVQIETGNYKVRFFILEIVGKFMKYVAILAPTKTVELNPHIEMLE